jgi:hypothetical protein
MPEQDKTRIGAGGLFAEREVRAAAVHLFAYLAVNALLIAINLLVTPGTIWFPWPLLGWGIGLAIHAWLVYRAVLRRTAERYATEQRILQEIHLERQAAEIAEAIAQRQEEAPKKKKAAVKRRRKAPTKRTAKSKTAAKPKGAAKSRKTSAAAKSRKTAKGAGRSRGAATEKS